MAGNTKNLGQVAGVHIGTTPPSNTILIWYDSTPSQQRHKVYDPSLQQWVVLDQNIISSITYSELVNIAKNVGLSVGEWFQITDRSNALALAVTSTKVQYCDAVGNILIDDLGTNIQYHVTSSNLSIDDVTGVFDETNKKLVFQFNEHAPDFTSDDYVLGKVKRNNIWSLAKYKLSSFLSKVTGNSITWNGGFFFSFSEELKKVVDKRGGVVSKDTYDTDREQIITSINNVGKENQNIIQNAQNSVTEATTDSAVYGKKLPSLSTGGEPTDIAKNDTLLNIVSKIQRWINRFKYATGIRVSTDFADAKTGQYINNNDTIDSALRKVQYWLKKLKISENISMDDQGHVALSKYPLSDTDRNIYADDSVLLAIRKLMFLSMQIQSWQIEDETISFEQIQRKGVLPTDIFRIDLTTSFDFSGCGIGCCILQGRTNNFFAFDPSYPYNPYRLRSFYNSAFPKILGFSPVIPVLPNNTNNYSIACSFVHYDGNDGVNLQCIMQLSKAVYDKLYGDGNRYLKCVLQADIYNHKTDEQTAFISLAAYVNIVNIGFSSSVLQQGGQQHVIMNLSITPTQSQS